MPEKYIFEILIYNIDEKEFYANFKKFIGKNEHINTKNIVLMDYLEKKYGCPWRYNQVFGAIRIYILGTQLRGELWLSDKKKFTRNSIHKRISFFGNVFEIEVDNDFSNSDIVLEIDKSLQGYQNENKRIVLDLECYDNLKKFIDWKSIKEKNRQ